ncbi:MAG: nucleotide pyrophosphohydrolase [Clostridia bacterium]|nr:nucleotide pyrophosphohydrolase [Clostridia bacterium]
MVEITIKQLQDYLLEHYKDGGIDQSLFMKLVEEIGEVADVLNQKAGRKAAQSTNLHQKLGEELADVIHYAIAIAALNDIDISQAIVNKDKLASLKYKHKFNLEEFVNSFNKNKQKN